MEIKKIIKSLIGKIFTKSKKEMVTPEEIEKRKKELDKLIKLSEEQDKKIERYFKEYRMINNK